MDIEKELERYKILIENELDIFIPKINSPQKKVFEAMRYSILAGGKRLRPILVLKTCELVGGDPQKVIPFALAIEMIHTYSLIHDDLPAMDDDDYRRGKLTNHKVFGEAVAILAGDGLLNLAYEIMINYISDQRDEIDKYLRAFREIARSAGTSGMIGGQVVDILSENTVIDKSTLRYIHNNKTSALLEASIVSGAIIGGASNTEIDILRAYGKALGLCFQIRDDILDKTGDIHKLGKDIGSDDIKNKATYVTIYGLEESIKKTEDLCNEAINFLDVFHNDKVDFFKELAKYLVIREN